jgi:hypothetical protein
MTRRQRTTKTNDLGDDLEILKTTRRAAGGGTWVIGRVAGYRFDALVFPEHADNPEWELGTSRISKLWLARIANKETSFNWDRGLDMPASSKNAQAVVDFLAAGLAEHIFGK